MSRRWSSFLTVLTVLAVLALAVAWFVSAGLHTWTNAPDESSAGAGLDLRVEQTFD